jgi:hypothetical protein
LVSKQETFNQVWNHLKQQGKPALDEKGDCCYRTEEGLMCAVGCLIPDSEYDPAWEGYNIYGLMWSGLENHCFGLLESLQLTHDDWQEESDEWFWNSMREIARNYDLEVPDE